MRLDLYLYENGFAESRSRAKFLILEGAVSLNGSVATKPSQDVSSTGDDIKVSIKTDVCPYVSVGGLKLAAALDAFEIDVTGAVTADIGASTGGFSDCLLKRGAARVYAIDSGAGQLHETLLHDSRVILMEHTNARYLKNGSLPEECGFAAADVSFISQCLIIPAVYEILSENGIYAVLIKPQFELEKTDLSRGGIVRGDAKITKAVLRVIECAAQNRFECGGIIKSPVLGGNTKNTSAPHTGNLEFFAMFYKKNKPAATSISRRKIGEFIKNEKDCCIPE